MANADGEAAVATLVEAVVEAAGSDVDFREVARRLNDGVALIASLHPEVHDPTVLLAIEDAVSEGIAAGIISSGR